jgi:hypothetical protein
MATKSRTGLARVEHKPNKPKKTHQGNGQHSRARGTRKLLRGQGK